MGEIINKYFQSVGIVLILGLFGFESFRTHTIDTEVELRRRLTKTETQIEMLQGRVHSQNVTSAGLQQWMETSHRDYDELKQEVRNLRTDFNEWVRKQ